MQRDTLTARDAVAILFPPDTTNPAAPFRSGADVCELLAEHFGFAADDHAKLLTPLPTFEPGTVLVCPGCESERLTIWDLAPVAYYGGGVVAGTDGRAEPDYDGAYDTELGEGGEPDNCSCSECGGVWEFHELRPAS